MLGGTVSKTLSRTHACDYCKCPAATEHNRTNESVFRVSMLFLSVVLLGPIVLLFLLLFFIFFFFLLLLLVLLLLLLQVRRFVHVVVNNVASNALSLRFFIVFFLVFLCPINPPLNLPSTHSVLCSPSLFPSSTFLSYFLSTYTSFSCSHFGPCPSVSWRQFLNFNRETSRNHGTLRKKYALALITVIITDSSPKRR